MNSIPNHLIIQSCCHTPSNCKDQFSVECLSQQFKHLPTLFSIWKVGCSSCSLKRLTISDSRFHAISDDDSTSRISITFEFLIYIMIHGSIGLITSHMSKDDGADGTFSPHFISNKLQETMFMILMRTSQHKNIIIKLFRQLLFHIFNNIFFKTYHTFFFFHLTFP